VLGDRFEMFAVASALVPFRVPVVHVHGGELTFGAIDDLFRHAMTKLSHLHMTSTEAYRRRVIQMGEAPWRVHAVGAPALDGILASASAPENLDGWDLPQEPFALVTYHPETQLDDVADDAMLEAMLEALSASPLHVIITAPNADPRGQGVRARLERFVSAHAQRARLVANFGIPTYYHVMRRACCMVGNSSSGILEAASFGLPVVNLGGRQQGRLSAENVLNVTHPSTQEIARMLTQTQDARWRASLTSMSNPYGDGHAAGRIVEAMAQGLEHPNVTRKIFEDLNFSLNS
jgi:UDP-hydrolysing UDP-N-acetyl-D-glucosamine 2-epimerase